MNLMQKIGCYGTLAAGMLATDAYAMPAKNLPAIASPLETRVQGSPAEQQPEKKQDDTTSSGCGGALWYALIGIVVYKALFEEENNRNKRY